MLSLEDRAAAGDKKAERELDRREREEDREFDRHFEETPFEKLLDRLPIRKPPLHVEQYITTQGSHKVYTAVSKKRFLCQMTPHQRLAAVRAFYRHADAVVRRGGVKDFVQVVTPLAETAERLPALAVGRNGSVSLTKRGRKGAC